VGVGIQSDNSSAATLADVRAGLDPVPGVALRTRKKKCGSGGFVLASEYSLR
jgi:hypothetical protein